MVNKQVFQHMDFCRRLPHFTKLPHNDQMYLLKQSLNELLILNIAYTSIQVSSNFKISLKNDPECAHTQVLAFKFSNLFFACFDSMLSLIDGMPMDHSRGGKFHSKCVSHVIIHLAEIWPFKRVLCKYLIESYRS